MANPEHLAKLKEGVEAWNVWRDKNIDLIPDLRKHDFSREDLSNINLSNARLNWCIFRNTMLQNALFSGADLFGANMSRANLSGAVFENATMKWTDLTRTILTGANLIRANLSGANLLQTNLEDADISGCAVFGINVWEIRKQGLKQHSLKITKHDIPEITVDDLEIAQFIYLLLNNQKFRDVIETITSKAVLILGRFTNERKKILDAIRDELRQRNYLPILFDFEKPATRDLTETISILAKLSRYVIADLTDAKSIPQELSHIIPFMPNLPVIPIILHGQREYAMFEHWKPYPWVLPIYEYADEAHLLSTLAEEVIEPVERKVQELRNS